MIKVRLNRQSFQYDVHSLVRAFYPQEEVQVDCDWCGCASSDEAGREPQDTRTEVCLNGASFLLEISFLQEEEGDSSQTYVPSRIDICLYDKDNDRLHMESSCCEEDRKETKNELKRLLYRLLSGYSKRTLPWGNLTGIRPTKIPMKLLNEGRKNSEIAQYMRETYYTSNEKTALAISIANREHALLSRLRLNREADPDAEVEKQEHNAPADEISESDRFGLMGKVYDGEHPVHRCADVFRNGYSLYIGIPFCPSICLYCSFSSSPLALWKDKTDSYLDALCYEIESVADLLPDRRPDTVYIGGGTPTTLEPDQMERLLTKIEKCFDLGRTMEFTVEAGRPDSITREKLSVLKAHGITRISINPQTMNQKTLDFIGRRHTTEETMEAFALAREMGFDNINMDLIVGLPGEGASEVEHTMQILSKMDPDSITVHSLAVKRAARLRLFREEHKELNFENSSEIMNMTAAYTREAGLFPYYLYRQKNMAGNFENVGYAKSGCEGLYNILIMEEVQTILALGAGASTKLVYPDNRISRIENVKDIRSYMERIDEMIARKRAGLYE